MDTSTDSIHIRHNSNVYDKLGSCVRWGGHASTTAGSFKIHNLTSYELRLRRSATFDGGHASAVTLEHLRRKINKQDSALDDQTIYTTLAENITIGPLTTWQSSIVLSASKANELLVLHLEHEPEVIERWECRLLVSSAHNTTQSVHLRTGSGCAQAAQPVDAATTLLAMYEAESCMLTLFSTCDRSRWMQGFDGSTSLAALSIPGTHNTPTYHHALPSVRCQAVSPLEQLKHGVRFFDVRVQLHNPSDPNDETLNLVHGAFPISLTGHKRFRTLLNDIEAFLKHNPSETLVLCLKREGTGSGTDAQLADVLSRHYAAAWYTEARIPSLGEVRGKVVLMRRFGLSSALQGTHPTWGLHAECWPDNTSSAEHGNVNVQDFYEVQTRQQIPTKFDLVCAQMERAAAVVYPLPSSSSMTSQQPSTAASQPPQHVFLNFLSASNFWNILCWPKHIAARLNPAVRKFLCDQHADRVCSANPSEPVAKGDNSLGIMVCDWVGRDHNWDLVDCIVGMNSVRLLKEMESRRTPDGDAEQKLT